MSEIIKDALRGLEAQADGAMNEMDQHAPWSDKWVEFAKQFISAYERHKDLSSELEKEHPDAPKGDSQGE